MVKVLKSYLKYFRRNDFLKNKKIQKNDFFAIFHEIQGGGWWPPQGHVLQPSRFSPVLCECIGPRTPITEAIREIHLSFSHPNIYVSHYFRHRNTSRD